MPAAYLLLSSGQAAVFGMELRLELLLFFLFISVGAALRLLDETHVNVQAQEDHDCTAEYKQVRLHYFENIQVFYPDVAYIHWIVRPLALNFSIVSSFGEVRIS